MGQSDSESPKSILPTTPHLELLNNPSQHFSFSSVAHSQRRMIDNAKIIYNWLKSVSLDAFAFNRLIFQLILGAYKFWHPFFAFIGVWTKAESGWVWMLSILFPWRLNTKIIQEGAHVCLEKA